MIRPSAFRVFVAGGGVAGLEALLAPRDLAGARVELTLLSPDTDFAYRPMAVAEPFARGHAARHALADIARDLGGVLVRGALAEPVDLERDLSSVADALRQASLRGDADRERSLRAVPKRAARRDAPVWRLMFKVGESTGGK